MYTVSSTSIDNLEQKLFITENVALKYPGPLFHVGVKYPGPLSGESAKIYFHDLSFKQKDDHTCYIIKYSETVLVLYDIVKKEMEETKGTESRRTVRRWLVQIPDHSFQ